MCHNVYDDAIKSTKLQNVTKMTNFFPRIGASAAAMLIFILPSAFYIKLVKKESMKSVQKIGVRIQFLHLQGYVRELTEFPKHHQKAVHIRVLDC